MSKMKWHSKVFYLAIALALSLSLVGGATVSADPDTEWWEEWQPEVNGPDWVVAPNSAIYDFAADPAGDIIYAVGMGIEDHRLYGDEMWEDPVSRLWKSEDGAITWSDITDNLPDEFFDAGEDLYYVAIAPDNSDMVFVATEYEVYGSDDAGDDFGDSDFGVQSGGEYILCLAVSCESDDDYTIAVGTDGGEVWRLVTGGFLGGAWKMIGGYDVGVAVYAGWDDSDVDGLLPSMTTTAVTSVAFSPKFDSDDTILAITTDDSGTYLQTGRLGNVEQWNYIAGSAFPDAVEIVDAPPLWTDSAGATGIALSADYDGRKGSLRYAWVYVDYDDTDDDPDLGELGRVFQIDNDDVDYAGIPCVESKFSPMLASISAYGTEEEGKLMVGLLGDYDTGEPTDCSEGVEVYYTTMPIDPCCPDWDSSDKAPTGQEWAVVAYVSDGDKAYASTMGEGISDEGAFSISEIEEVGLYWNQYSLIDTDIDYLSDVGSVADTWNAGQYFLVSVNLWNEGCWEQECASDSVWYSEDWGEHYMRIWCGEFTPNDVNVAFVDDPTDEIGFIRVSPDESSWVETLYLVDRGTEIVWWNDSSGLTDWSEQSTCTLDTISDLAVADSSTIYAVSADAAEVAKSTDNGESWDDPVDADMISGEIGHTIAVEGDEVLVGSMAGSVSYSDDGGDSYEILAWEGAAGSGNIHVAFDAYYGLNDTVYAADGDGGGIRRWVIGSSSSFEKLDATPTLTQMGGSGTDEIDVDFYGIVSKSSGMCDADDGGVLYAAYAYNDGTDYYTGVARCLSPAADLCCGEADWDYLHAELDTGEPEYCDMYPQQFTSEPSSLIASGTPGYIYLNAIDNLAVYADELIDCYGCYYAYDYWWPLSTLWGYEDCFAEGGVSLSAPGSGSLIPSDPCNCWNEKFVLKWDQPCDGCLYDVQIALDEDFNDMYLEWEDYDPPSARSPSLVVDDGDLDCSTTYYWRVRSTEADTGEVVRSWWSVAWDFAVEAGPMGAIELTSPDNGVTNVPVKGVVFIWTSVDGADTYNFSLMDAGGTEVDSQTGLTGTSYAYAGTLGLDTAYTWQVTAMKGTGMSKSDTVSVSQIYTFRTAPAPVPPPEAPAPAPPPTTPSWVWVIIGIGAVLVITVIVLIFRTRRV